MGVDALIEGPVHFVGIGGAGQRATAELLLGQGLAVSGSDVQESAALGSLRRRGAHVYVGHSPERVADSRLVVVSSAVPSTDPEIVAARARGIPVIKNAELLRRIGSGRRTVAVAGTHGKTTTTSMVAWTLTWAGLDPAVIVGGEVRNLGLSGRAGAGPWFVVEADEYDRRFLNLDPWVAVVTNVEADHLDYYGTVEQMRDAFRQFVGRVPPDGQVVLCGDDAGSLALAEAAGGAVVTYGLGAAEWRARAIAQRPEGTAFAVERRGRECARCTLQVPGLHNVRNALACFAAADAAGVGPDRVAGALGEFQGARRRFEVLGEVGGVTVLTDYGHLPAELRVTLAAARQRYPGARLWAVFQPHTYARTRLWMDEFVLACREADRALIVGAYVPSGREQVHLDEETRELARRLDVPYLAGRADVPAALHGALTPGDVVLLLGAGDINLAGEPLLHALQERA